MTIKHTEFILLTFCLYSCSTSPKLDWMTQLNNFRWRISEEEGDEKHTQLAKLFVKYKFPMSFWPTQTINLHAHVLHRHTGVHLQNFRIFSMHLSIC